MKECCREVLWRGVVEKCCREVLWRGVVEKCCREVKECCSCGEVL